MRLMSVCCANACFLARVKSALGVFSPAILFDLLYFFAIQKSFMSSCTHGTLWGISEFTMTLKLVLKRRISYGEWETSSEKQRQIMSTSYLQCTFKCLLAELTQSEFFNLTITVLSSLKEFERTFKSYTKVCIYYWNSPKIFQNLGKYFCIFTPLWNSKSV